MLLNNKIFKALVSCALVLALAFSVMVPAFAAPGDELSMKEQVAQEMMNDWIDAFVFDEMVNGQKVGLTHRRWTNGNTKSDFWVSAIIYDSFNDVLEYSEDEAYKAEIEEIMHELYTGFFQGWGSYYQTNDYNDDICWWAMCLERASRLSSNPEYAQEYYDMAQWCIDRVLEDFYDDTWAAQYSPTAFGGAPWGAILWRWSDRVSIPNNSIDMCANGNTAMVCCRFASRYREQGNEAKALEYEEYAKSMLNWIQAHLCDRNDPGKVYNAIQYNGNMQTWQFTYNYGVCAGAAYELYKNTGDQSYLATAIQVMQYGFDTLNQADGLTIKYEGPGDRVGASANANKDDADAFKNIMLRIAAQMYHEGAAPQFKKYMDNNAIQAYLHRRPSDGLIGSNIAATPGNGYLYSPCTVLAPSFMYWGDLADEDFPEIPAPPEPGDIYEAEEAYSEYMAWNTQNGASGQNTQYWDADAAHVMDGFVEFTVNVDRAGTYFLDMRVFGRDQNVTRRISVNGGPAEKHTFTYPVQNEWWIASREVNLNKGANKIRISLNNRNNHPDDYDGQTWFFLDYIEIRKSTPAVTVETDKAEYAPNADITFTVTTGDEVMRIGLQNENGKFLGKASENVVENEDGTLTWTITTSIATKGEREIAILTDSGDGKLEESGATVELNITPAAAAVSDDATLTSAVLGADTAKKNETITATVVTGTGIAKIGIFNEAGKPMGKISESYVDADGVRTWTVEFAIGSRGTRALTINGADAAGEWTETAVPVEITIK